MVENLLLRTFSLGGWEGQHEESFDVKERFLQPVDRRKGKGVQPVDSRKERIAQIDSTSTSIDSRV